MSSVGESSAAEAISEANSYEKLVTTAMDKYVVRMCCVLEGLLAMTHLETEFQRKIDQST